MAIFILAVLGIFLGLTKVIGNLPRSVFFILSGDLPTKTAEEMVLTIEYHYFAKERERNYCVCLRSVEMPVKNGWAEHRFPFQY